MNHSDHDSTEERILVGLSKISLALKSQSWQDAGQHGVSPTQAQILSLLQAQGDEGMGLAAVAEGLAVTPATASDAVRVLDEKGLVQKVRSPQDGRAITITLTPKGQKLAAQTSCWSDLFLDAVGELSELEQTVFLRGLIKMIRKLQQAGQIPISKMCVTCRFFQPNRYPGSDQPHHCDWVDAPFGDRNLHLECSEQIEAAVDQATKDWESDPTSVNPV
ncbi:MarR family winged helix-turn-helix transcriptional regulator [Planktothrix mougeotii]|uniref:Winged helix-turn-helix transcriptional regulator n=1 Tax=Planktothrix mougeotii LEGE 06226 TaxID=1828728 RepID=A0ABR9UIG2_9CYAN|nr:MarR family winged helix-turn-helix transcriptional regulator [Planktothrix mougeotii]MBE9146243.1 winged helix-turn-helix transcriptional regulator [Planktothrix mougeotii LEGE 06226]